MIEDLSRYDRQIIMPEIGEEGQKKLRTSSVLVVGAGGLGSPALLYLAGAGIGKIGIVDNDTVSITNLHRQVIHPATNVGKNKAESAKETLEKLNSDVEIRTYPFLLTSENIDAIIAEYDFVIDAVDNFETKFLINDSCVHAKKPFCYGGVIRFNGQVMTYVPGKGPCIRCIFEEIPDPKDVPKCIQVGVLGPVCGLIGCIEASEAIKYLVGSESLLTGKMFIADIYTMKTRIAPFPKVNENCKVCG